MCIKFRSKGRVLGPFRMDPSQRKAGADEANFWCSSLFPDRMGFSYAFLCVSAAWLQSVAKRTGTRRWPRDSELAWWNEWINMEPINFILACGTREI